MIYLASPYSHPLQEVVEKRHEEAMAYTHYLLERKRWVYSPIVHCHELAKRHSLPTDFEYWKRYNYHALARCDELYVLGIEGWRESKGVRAEIEFWVAMRDRAAVLFINGSTRSGLTYDGDMLLDMIDGIRA
jgi:hypothetical protein